MPDEQGLGPCLAEAQAGKPGIGGLTCGGGMRLLQGLAHAAMLLLLYVATQHAGPLPGPGKGLLAAATQQPLCPQLPC